jgi:hypothetical protein
MATLKSNQNVRTGNRVAILFGGVQIGLLQNLSPNDDYGLEPAAGIGDIHVQEYVPTVARHSLSASSMLLPNKNLKAAGIASENGDDALQGLVFDIEIYDKYTGELLRKYVDVSYGGGSCEIRANAIIVSNAQFMARDVTSKGL